MSENKIFDEPFCVLILTHGRANNVVTHRTLRKLGYTGPIYLVIDNTDKQKDEYINTYGKNYKYAHGYEGNFVEQDFLPEEIRTERIYKPQNNAVEVKILERLKKWWGERF